MNRLPWDDRPRPPARPPLIERPIPTPTPPPAASVPAQYPGPPVAPVAQPVLPPATAAVAHCSRCTARLPAPGAACSACGAAPVVGPAPEPIHSPPTGVNPSAVPQPLSGFRRRVGVVLRVELTEGRRRSSPLAIVFVDLICAVLPYVLVAAFLFVLCSGFLSGPTSGFFGRLAMELGGSFLLLLIVGAAFLGMLRGPGRGGVLDQFFQTLFRIVQTILGILFRLARGLAESLRRGLTSWRMQDRMARSVQVRTVDVEEEGSGQLFSFQIRGELLPGCSIARGQRVAVEGMEQRGIFVVRGVTNLTTRTELRWTDRPI